MHNRLRKFPFSLGTAQLGLNYGLTNQNGYLTNLDVQNILTNDYISLFQFIDTAESYGTSIQRLGKYLSRPIHGRIINKILLESLNDCSLDCHKVSSKLSESLRALGIERFDTILIHDAKVIQRCGWGNVSYMLKYLKGEGFAGRVGLSIYDPQDLIGADLRELDVIQLPLSPFNQTFLEDRHIDPILCEEIEIHGRSLFLQGLLLVDNIPSTFIDMRLRRHHQRYVADVYNLGITLLDACVAFALSLSSIFTFVIGLTSVYELQAIVGSYDHMCQVKNPINWKIYDFLIRDLIDPRYWP